MFMLLTHSRGCSKGLLASSKGRIHYDSLNMVSGVFKRSEKYVYILFTQARPVQLTLTYQNPFWINCVRPEKNISSFILSDWILRTINGMYIISRIVVISIKS